MPFVGTTAYNTAAQVLSLVRSLLNDVAGNVFSDPVLLPYCNSAYRKVQRALANVGSPNFIQDDVLFTLPAVAAQDASVQTSLTDTGYNNGTQNYTVYGGVALQLPTALLVPVKIWERQAGSSDNFEELTELTSRGGLPSQVQGQFLEYWEWRSDGIWFLGATQDEQIRLRFQAAFADLTDPTSPILVRNAQEAIAYFTAALAAAARGAPSAERYDAAGEDALEDLVNRATQQQQGGSRRRRPYSWRKGYGPLV